MLMTVYGRVHSFVFACLSSCPILSPPYHFSPLASFAFGDLWSVCRTHLYCRFGLRLASTLRANRSLYVVGHVVDSVQSAMWRFVILVLVALPQFGDQLRLIGVKLIGLGENPAGRIPVSNPARAV
jgi:hypothetical protein